MKIISKFHDYYDSVLAYGGASDDHVIFKRLIVEIEKYDLRDKSALVELIDSAPNKPRYFQYWRNDGDEYLMKTFIIGFCGKVYPIIKLESGDSISCRAKNFKEAWAYDIDQVDAFMKADKKMFASYNKKRSSWSNKTPRSSRDKIAGFFETYSKSEEFTELFFEYKTPIFVINVNDSKTNAFNNESYMRLSLNIKLKDYKFMKVMDTFTTYQEIEMYISGVLGVDARPMVEISDLKKRDKQGFDNWSFKTRPNVK